MADEAPPFRTAKDLVELFDLEKIDADLFRGINERTAGERPALFGGQVAAQALRAAALTVPEGRLPHSLHGYFLRPGRAQMPVILRVDRDRDGRSFSARHVSAIQEGQVIFSALASFQVPESGPEFEPPLPAGAVLPEELDYHPPRFPFGRALEMQPFPPARLYEPGEFPVPARMWAKSGTPLPDDPVVHACALTYLSDVGSGFADGDKSGIPRGGPSLDHAIWFHHPVKADDWMLLWLSPLKAGGSRGLYTGTMYDTSGKLLAVINQEILFRWNPPMPPPSL
ncbi:MAG TPA: acyl-CoA thioesterase domain-containing protein [Acidimicrobiales bacterium]|nr:acyl-CoA thioesterase domain-containing protein [Acidimicrobiales bacterium]